MSEGSRGEGIFEQKEAKEMKGTRGGACRPVRNTGVATSGCSRKIQQV